MKNADTPTPEQIERRIEWEAAAVAAGVRRYREEINDPSRALADTSPGQRMIRQIMRELVPAFDRALRPSKRTGRQGLDPPTALKRQCPIGASAWSVPVTAAGRSIWW